MTTSTSYKILDMLDKDLTFPLLNPMFNGEYKYTLNRYREYLSLKVKQLQQQPNQEPNQEITQENIDTYLLNKIKQTYFPLVSQRCQEIASIPIVEQKSPEWFRLREGMISASDAGYFLKKCGNSKAMDALKIKIGLKNYATSTAPPLLHGNTYEDVTRAIYESRNQVTVTEYGILSSPTSCIGASPDGIVTSCNSPSFECQSRYGRLLEIKNPYSREIDNTIKPEYMVQILQQQYTTGLPVCDFVETTIVDKYCKNINPNYPAYETLDDMLNDKLDINNANFKNRVRNANIPYDNLTKYGNEKGVVVWYSKVVAENDIRNRYILYPLDGIYEKSKIEKWIVDMNSIQFADNFFFKEIKYWRLEVYCEKTVVYDAKLFEGNYIPELVKIWDVICNCKNIRMKSTSLNDIEQYLEGIEKDSKNPFYNENKRRKKLTSSTSSTSSISNYSNTTLPNTPSKSISFENNDDIELDF
jgi:hypothetical protein